MMLKKLKRKFVIINMCLVGIVMLIVFSVVCINTYRQAVAEVDGALSMALEKTGQEKFEPFEIGKRPDGIENFRQPGRENKPMGGKPFNYAAVVALVDEAGGERQITPLGMENASMSEAVMSEAVAAAMASDDIRGRLYDMDLFYMKSEGLHSTKIAFADSTYFESSVKKTILTSLVLFVLGMIALLLISLLLAKIAVEPVKKAWDQQKRFIADASHELKTPLTVILANTEIMMEETGTVSKWMESSKEEANHMKELVDDLLFLAKADEMGDAKEAFAEKKDLDISDVVTGVALQMEPVVYETGAVLETDIHEGIHLKGDLTQMKQLVHILLDNGVKYCGEAGTVSLSLNRDGSAVKLVVKNTGEVMDGEDLEHIFDRFYRSDKARTGEGHGLGLSIAKTIVENHGGTIRAYSGKIDGCQEQDMMGTVMTVVFPD